MGHWFSGSARSNPSRPLQPKAWAYALKPEGVSASDGRSHRECRPIPDHLSGQHWSHVTHEAPAGDPGAGQEGVDRALASMSGSGHKKDPLGFLKIPFEILAWASTHPRQARVEAPSGCLSRSNEFHRARVHEALVAVDQQIEEAVTTTEEVR